MLHDAENGVVICGDTALGKGVQTPEGKRVPPYYADPSLYVVGIETAVALKGATYCTGHNGVLTYDQMVEFANESKEMVEWLDTYSFLKGKTLGYPTGADGGYRVVGESYIPDVAFISKAREPEPSREAYNPNPPDLAVEVLPPSNDADDMRIKVVNYLAVGTQVWVVQPDEQQVEVYIPGQLVTVLAIDGILDGRNLLPGFTLKISDIFAGI